jgi:DNA-binding transcriptional ArsR family regulator
VSDDATGLDGVFKALADPTRRRMLDRLRAHNGQTLGTLCAELGMTRQAATQHLDLLAGAGLVAVVRRGRERLHYLNPAPIHELSQRWIAEFDRPRLRALAAIKTQAEEYAMTDASVPSYVYVTYIRASADQVWRALTDADLTARFWGHANVSDWAGHDVRRAGRRPGHPVCGHVPGRAAPGDRPADRHPRAPGRRGRAGRDRAGLAGGAGKPQVAAGDRRRAAERAVGDDAGLTATAGRAG